MTIGTTQYGVSARISQHTLQLFHPLALLYPSTCSLGNCQLHVCMNVIQLEIVSPFKILKTRLHTTETRKNLTQNYHAMSQSLDGLGIYLQASRGSEQTCLKSMMKPHIRKYINKNMVRRNIIREECAIRTDEIK